MQGEFLFYTQPRSPSIDCVNREKLITTRQRKSLLVFTLSCRIEPLVSFLTSSKEGRLIMSSDQKYNYVCFILLMISLCSISTDCLKTLNSFQVGTNFVIDRNILKGAYKESKISANGVGDIILNHLSNNPDHVTQVMRSETPSI